MIHCWLEKARERPSFSTLHSHLLSCYANLNLKKQTDTPPSIDTPATVTTSTAATTGSQNGVTPATTPSTITMDNGGEEEDSLSADNSRAVLLPDGPDEDHTPPQTNNCDLVLTTSGYGRATQDSGCGSALELSVNNMYNNIEHSMSLGLQLGSSGEYEQYTKL